MLCSNLGQLLPTQNRPPGPIYVGKRLFLACFGQFLAPLGPHLGYSGSDKWAKLVILNVLWPYFGAFLGPWKAQICEMPGAQVGTELRAHSGTKKKH